MFKLLISIAILIYSSVPALAAKIAAIDLTRVYEEYPLIQEANKAIDDAESRLKRVLATADKELKELESKGSQEAILAKQDEIQDLVDEEVEKLHDQKEAYNLEINRNIERSLKKLAETYSYELILNKIQTAGDTEDVTDQFLTELKTVQTPTTTGK